MLLAGLEGADVGRPELEGVVESRGRVTVYWTGQAGPGDVPSAGPAGERAERGLRCSAPRDVLVAGPEGICWGTA